MEIIAGKYQIIKKLGEGGCGSVYLVRNIELDMLFAVKLIIGSKVQDPRFIARFKREAVVLTRLMHRNTVALRDFGRTEEGHLYMAMDYSSGRSLRDILDSDGPFSPHRALNIMIQSLDVISNAHKVGIVHRDIKPSNIMLETNKEGVEEVKVLDFGIARLTQELTERDDKATSTKEGAIVGTPMYMSPEQAYGEGVDNLTDIYALGLVMYHMLTGKEPFTRGETEMKILMSQLNLYPPTFKEMGLDFSIPHSLEQIVFKAIQKEKEKRFQSASEFLKICLRVKNSPDLSNFTFKKSPSCALPSPPSKTAGTSTPLKTTDTSIPQTRSERLLPPGGGHSKSSSPLILEKYYAAKRFNTNLLIGVLFLLAIITAGLFYKFNLSKREKVEKKKDSIKGPKVKKESPKALYKRGKEYFKKGNLTEALTTFEKILTHHPEFQKKETLLNYQGRIYYLKKDYLKAIHHFTKAINQDSERAEFYFNRAFTRLCLLEKREGFVMGELQNIKFGDGEKIGSIQDLKEILSDLKKVKEVHSPWPLISYYRWLVSTYMLEKNLLTPTKGLEILEIRDAVEERRKSIEDWRYRGLVEDIYRYFKMDKNEERQQTSYWKLYKICVRKREYTKAIRAGVGYSKWNGESHARISIASLAHRKGYSEEALKVLSKPPKKSLWSPEFLALRARIKLTPKNFRKIKEDSARGISMWYLVYPHNKLNVKDLISLYIFRTFQSLKERRVYMPYRDYYRAGLVSKRTRDKYYNSYKLTKHITRRKEIIKKKHKGISEALKFYKEAQKLFNKRNYREAELKCLEALDRHHVYPEALHLKGNAILMQRRFMAIEDFTLAIIRNPGLLQARLDRMRYYIWLLKHKKLPTPFLNFAFLVKFSIKNLDSLIKKMEGTSRIHVNWAKMYGHWGKVYEQIGLTLMTKATMDMKVNYRGLFYDGINCFKKAIKYYTLALKKSPSGKEAMNRRIKGVYTRLKEYLKIRENYLRNQLEMVNKKLETGSNYRYYEQRGKIYLELIGVGIKEIIKNKEKIKEYENYLKVGEADLRKALPHANPRNQKRINKWINTARDMIGQLKR